MSKVKADETKVVTEASTKALLVDIKSVLNQILTVLKKA